MNTWKGLESMHWDKTLPSTDSARFSPSAPYCITASGWRKAEIPPGEQKTHSRGGTRPSSLRGVCDGVEGRPVLGALSLLPPERQIPELTPPASVVAFSPLHPQLLITAGSCFYSLMCILEFLAAQTVKNLPAMPETQVWSPGWEDPLEKEMETHSSVLAWRIPWTEEPGGLQSTEFQRIRQTNTNTFTIICPTCPRITSSWETELRWVVFRAEPRTHWALKKCSQTVQVNLSCASLCT